MAIPRLPVLSAVVLAALPLSPQAPGPKAAERDRSRLLEGVGAPLEVYLVPESAGAEFADANCYLIADRSSGEAMVVDAGARSAPVVLARAAELKLKLTFLVSTHFHGDHTGGNSLVLGRTAARMAAPAKEAGLLTGEDLTAAEKKQVLASPTPRIDLKVRHGDELKLGSHPVKVIEVGGHSPGGICLHFPDQKLLFPGDSLLKGTIGRVGLPRAAKTPEGLVAALRSRLLTLPDDTSVLPGHGPPTTIGAERAQNPWLKKN